MHRRLAFALAGLIAAVVCGLVPVAAQTPEAVVSGTVTDVEGRPLAGATVTASHTGTGFSRETTTDAQGAYAFLALPRGAYNLKATREGYQGLERQQVELAAGDRMVEDFALSSISASNNPVVSDLLQVLPPAPSLPVETVASSVSVVVDEDKILRLPLADRNIYSLFLLQPGVTSQGAIVRRGLSFAVHGQRVSGSNYLLDGVDNNNIVFTGPVTTTSAEAVQEFRMTNSSFSAENGRATSFVAQVVTRSGANQLHGTLFEFLSHDELNANTFANNANGVAKPAMRQNQFGFSVTGPIARNRTFFASTLEFSRLRFDTQWDVLVPSAQFISTLPENSVARRLLTAIPPVPGAPTPDPDIAEFIGRKPNRIDTIRATERIDHQFDGGKDRLLARYSIASTDERPALEESTAYPSLQRLDHYGAHNAVLGWSHSPVAGANNDLRIGWNREQVQVPRVQPQIPILQGPGILLPLSLRESDERQNNNVIQFSDVYSLRIGRSSLSLGFEFRRNLEDGLTLGLEDTALGGAPIFVDGFYLFPDLASFAQGQPLAFAISADRFSGGAVRVPDLRRRYRSNDYAAFIQDDWKVTRRFSLNLGLRYEYYGVPHSTDRSQDVNLYFGPGSTIEERLANGGLRSTDQNPGDLKGLLYRRDRLNFAPSIGVAWDPFGRGLTVLRAGYAVAYDRVFDTLRDLRSNGQQVVNCFPPLCAPQFLIPGAGMLPFLDPLLPPASVVQLDENLRTPYAQNWYAGIQQTVTPNFLVEVGHVGSVGRKLISRDTVNRFINGVPLNPAILDDTFLSNAGNSNYLALEVGLRRRFSRGIQFQVSYTFSHAIDNESDVFEGVRTAPDNFAVAGFTRQFDARIDRGNANFDQRQNLIFNAIWDVPGYRGRHWLSRLSEGWSMSVIGGYRSGFPLTVLSSVGVTEDGLYNNRVDFIGTASTSPRTRIPGGVQWLDPAAFQPAAGHVGTLGRNALRGPGFWNYDFALSRSIGAAEGRVQTQFRAEFYNLFNHANLSAPSTLWLDPFFGGPNEAFGRAFYGLNQSYSRFGELPLDNASRRIQFALRIRF